MDTLRAITEVYERATFSDEGVSTAAAEQTLARARQLCGVGDFASVESADD